MEPNSWGLTLALTRNSGSAPDVHFLFGYISDSEIVSEGDCLPLVCWPHEINSIAVKAE